MSRASHAGPSSNAGFTLIELMIVVVVMGILAAIAVPLYGDSVMRSKIIGATTALGDIRTQMEKYFMDNRTYSNGGACGAAPAIASFNADPSRNFDISCPPAALSATTYTIQAAGIAARGTSGFVYTINEANAKTSSGPGGKYTNPACWALRKDGSC